VLSGRGLCDELITLPEESYRLWCVVVCDLKTTKMRRPWPTGGCCAKRREEKFCKVFFNSLSFLNTMVTVQDIAQCVIWLTESKSTVTVQRHFHRTYGTDFRVCNAIRHRVLVGRPEGRRPLGRPRRRREDNIKRDLQEVGGDCGNWMERAQVRDRWRTLVNTVMNFGVP
jgi:hypothetical protein